VVIEEQENGEHQQKRYQSAAHIYNHQVGGGLVELSLPRMEITALAPRERRNRIPVQIDMASSLAFLTKKGRTRPNIPGAINRQADRTEHGAARSQKRNDYASLLPEHPGAG